MSVPRRIGDLIGNAGLVGALVRGRLPAAALFEGPAGVGKRTLAFLLAVRANCRRPEGGEPCGSCPSCIKAFGGNHPDIRVYSPDTEGGRIKIEQMREMRQEAQYRPFEGKCRCFIIDPADLMTVEAANCILKTLEEPAETTHLSLVTAFPDQVLPTIRSRCLQLNFQPIPRAELERFLADRSLDYPELRAAVSRGSVGVASALDPASFRKDRDLALKLLEAWAPRQTFAAILSGCEKLGLRVRDRVTAQRYLSLLQDLVCDLHLLETGSLDRITNVDRVKELQKLSGLVTQERRSRLLDAFAAARRDVDRNVKPDACFETAWID